MLEQLMRRLYPLIREVHPDAPEVVRLGDKAKMSFVRTGSLLR